MKPEEDDYDADIAARKAFFVKFFKEFYPEINIDKNPDEALIRLVGSFEWVWGEDSPLSRLTWFAIDYINPEDIDEDMQNLKTYVFEKSSKQGKNE